MDKKNTLSYPVFEVEIIGNILSIILLTINAYDSDTLVKKDLFVLN
jgi:hypothetical protein